MTGPAVVAKTTSGGAKESSKKVDKKPKGRAKKQEPIEIALAKGASKKRGRSVQERTVKDVAAEKNTIADKPVTGQRKKGRQAKTSQPGTASGRSRKNAKGEAEADGGDEVVFVPDSMPAELSGKEQEIETAHEDKEAHPVEPAEEGEGEVEMARAGERTLENGAPVTQTGWGEEEGQAASVEDKVNDEETTKTAGRGSEAKEAVVQRSNAIASKGGQPGDSQAIADEPNKPIVDKEARTSHPNQAEEIFVPGSDTEEGNESVEQHIVEDEGKGETNEETAKKDENSVKINRAPVLTLWVAVVAVREGYAYEEGLTFGKAVSGLYANSKGKRLGIFEEPDEEVKESRRKKREEAEKFEVFGAKLAGKTTSDGKRFAVHDGKPIAPASVSTYLKKAFSDNLDRVKAAFEALAGAYPEDKIGKEGYHLYEKFRPIVSEGTKGWGAKGVLDLDAISSMAREAHDASLAK
eukprot:jgi/Mesen1/6232/ME000320S05423